MPELKALPAGDTALVVEFGELVDREPSTRVLALARRLDELRLEGVIETVPTFRSLMVHYDPPVLPAKALAALGLIAGSMIVVTSGLFLLWHEARHRAVVRPLPQIALPAAQAARI